uniref:Uncharacterized protein n=1 Tax=Brassica oleracea var. oleracea TaxID=109376 RepID=A0A0D3BVC3_BRAOL
MSAHVHQMFSDRIDAMQFMVERLPGVAPPIRKSNPDSYADTPFTDEITLIEMPRKFSFPVHSLLRHSQRQVRGAIRQQQGSGENLRQPLRNLPEPSGTPERLDSLLQSRKGGYPRMQCPHCYLCFQERSTLRWTPL